MSISSMKPEAARELGAKSCMYLCVSHLGTVGNENLDIRVNTSIGVKSRVAKAQRLRSHSFAGLRSLCVTH